VRNPGKQSKNSTLLYSVEQTDASPGSQGSWV
jgi:hypothetical protein